MNMRINRGWAGMTVLAIALSLQGCGGDEDVPANAVAVVDGTPATPTDLVDLYNGDFLEGGRGGILLRAA